MSDVDLLVVWAAGLFEGEGCFARNQKGASVSFGMQLATTDRDVIEAYAAVVQSICGRRPSVIKRPPPAPNHKQQYSVKFFGSDAETVYVAIRPWLGDRRRARADEIRDEVARYRDPARRRAICEECGNSFTPPLAVAAIAKFCSLDCGRRFRDRQPARRIARMRRYWSGKRSPSQDALW